jgi:pyrophosphate--fructose-6-phosphate 1-phosphotransferase
MNSSADLLHIPRTSSKGADMSPRKVAILTSGGLAPCLSSAVASLVEEWDRHDPSVEILGYRSGYAGVLTGDSIVIGAEIRRGSHAAHNLGGSPLGNSRVKLSNAADCEKRGLVGPGQNPLAVAAAQLVRDGVDVLHTVGGDDTAAAASELAAHLSDMGHELRVVALPKTIDNDIIPVRQSMGAATAADYGSRFAQNVIAEHSASPRSVVVHEVMGRDCGWLTAATARNYETWVREHVGIPGLVDPASWGLHAVHVPEIEFQIDELAETLSRAMDDHGNVNLFIAEGAGAAQVIAERIAAGEKVRMDAFGHPKLDAVNVGRWIADRLGELLDAEKTLVVKSGYFARSAPANAEDRALVAACASMAVESAIAGRVGVVGEDEERGDVLGLIGFDRVSGGKTLDVTAPWVRDLLAGVAENL